MYYDVDSEKEICDKEQEKKKQQARQSEWFTNIQIPSTHAHNLGLQLLPIWFEFWVILGLDIVSLILYVLQLYSCCLNFVKLQL